MTYHQKLSTLFLLSLIALSYPCILNGFPLVFGDTGTYLKSANELFIPADRSFMYGFFIRYTSITDRLIFTIITQSALVSISIYYMTISFFQEKILRNYSIAIFLTALLSAIPWFSSQLMPDFSVGICSLMIMTFMIRNKFSYKENLFIIIFLTLLISLHSSNILLSIPLAIFSCATSFIINKDKLLAIKKILIILIPIALSVIFLSSASYKNYKKLAILPYGNVMMLARLMDGGVAMDYLKINCNKNTDYKVCQILPEILKFYKEEKDLGSPPGYASDKFLWGGLNDSIGGFPETQKYASKIINESISNNPLKFFMDSLNGSMIQLKKVKIGDSFDPEPVGSPTYHSLMQWYGKKIYGYNESSQFKNGLNFRYINKLFILSFIILFSITMIMTIKTKNKLLIYFVLCALVTYIINSVICGSLSAVHERYNARILWIFISIGAIALSMLLDKKIKEK